MRADYIWRIQKRRIVPGTAIVAFAHSRWRRWFGLCRCINCCLAKGGSR